MDVDPIQLELMRNLFEAAAEEMGITLQRVAFSANIKERRDFSCALYDDSGELLAQAAHIPVHLGSMPAAVRAVRERIGPMRAGDVAIVNDPFAGGTHLPDITLVTPILHAGRAIGYAANRAHHADVGGISPGSMSVTRHIDDEGIRIEPALLYRGGEKNRELFDRILNAVRTPDERIGDLEAQLAANHVGAGAMLRMVDRHGAEAVLRYGRLLLDYSQKFMAAAIAEIPDGQYRFEDAMDDDGVSDQPIPIRAAVTIAGDRATIDLTGSADQVAGCINCPAAVARSAAYYCFACLMGGRVPLNGGCFRNISVITRPGSVLDARYPAAVVAGNTETSQRIVDVIFGALAQALPDRIPSASCGTMTSFAAGAAAAGVTAGAVPPVAPGARGAWTYIETIGGGSGAGPGFAGESAVHCHMTNTLNTPAEALELQYPLRVRQFQRAEGTGGTGKFRGGDGIIRRIEALADCTGAVLSDRRRVGPYGLSGGGRGTAGQDAIASQGRTTRLSGGKTPFSLRAGDILTLQTPGGGGWGAG